MGREPSGRGHSGDRRREQHGGGGERLEVGDDPDRWAPHVGEREWREAVGPERGSWAGARFGLNGKKERERRRVGLGLGKMRKREEEKFFFTKQKVYNFFS